MILTLWLAACSSPSPVGPSAEASLPAAHGSARRTSATLGDGTELDLSVAPPVVSGTTASLTATAELVAPAAPTRSILFTVDVSGSVLVPGEGCGGDFNEDGLADTALDCELAGAWETIQRAAAWGDLGEVGFVIFQTIGHYVDLGPASGAQRFSAPDADADADGEPDVLTVLKSTGYVDSSWLDLGLGVEEFSH